MYIGLQIQLDCDFVEFQRKLVCPSWFWNVIGSKLLFSFPKRCQLDRDVALDRCAMHGAGIACVIRRCAMHDCTVVPED